MATGAVEWTGPMPIDAADPFSSLMECIPSRRVRSGTAHRSDRLVHLLSVNDDSVTTWRHGKTWETFKVHRPLRRCTLLESQLPPWKRPSTDVLLFSPMSTRDAWAEQKLDL